MPLNGDLLGDGGRPLDCLDHLADDGVDGAKTELEEKLSRDNPRDVEQIADQGGLRLRVAFDDVDRLREAFALQDPRAHDLRPAEDGVQRSAQLVRDRRDELVLHPAGAFGLLARAELLLLDADRPLRAVEVREHARLGAQHLGLEGLEEKVDRAVRVAAEDLARVAAGGGDEDDGGAREACVRLDQPGQREPVHARHLHVDQHERELAAEQVLERLRARGGHHQGLTEGLQHRTERQQVRGQVVDHEDCRLSGFEGCRKGAHA